MRECGDCTLCCRVLRVEELNKPQNIECKYCNTGVGCTIYSIRPPSCKAFNCLWLQEMIPEEFKPNKVNVVFDITTDGKKIVVHSDPRYSDAFKRGAVGEYIEKIACEVVVIEGDKRYILTHDAARLNEINSILELERKRKTNNFNMRPKVFSTDNYPEVLAERNVSVSLTVDSAFRFDDTSSFKVFLQIEPPEVNDLTDRLIENHKFYDLILAWNTKILNACSNSVLFPLACCSWLPWGADGNNPNHARPQNGVPYTECDPSRKQFKASYLTSWKDWTPGHRLRQEIFDILPSNVGNLNITKHRSPPWIADKRDFLYDYQFTISPLNASHENWMDDKIGDPLIAKTIPLVWGCPNLSDYFNMDGIMQFQTIPEMLQKLSELTPSYYEEHFDAVMDNFQRALAFSPIWTRVDGEITKCLSKRVLS